MNDYYLRVREGDVPRMFQLAELMGILIQQRDIDGEPVPDQYTVHPDHQGALDIIGPIYEPTGNMITTPSGPDGETMEVPEMAPIKDTDGTVFWHANLRLNLDLADHAAALVDQHPEIQTAMGELSRWFVVGEDGKAVRPKSPSRVWM